MLDVLLFTLLYNIVFEKAPVYIGNYAISPAMAALWTPFPLMFIMSFLLSRFVVFHNTQLKKRVSLFRYAVLVAFSFVLNTALLRFFVVTCKWDAIVSKILCIFLIALFSYLTQKYYTFKHPKMSV